MLTNYGDKTWCQFAVYLLESYVSLKHDLPPSCIQQFSVSMPFILWFVFLALFFPWMP